MLIVFGMFALGTMAVVGREVWAMRDSSPPDEPLPYPSRSRPSPITTATLVQLTSLTGGVPSILDISSSPSYFVARDRKEATISNPRLENRLRVARAERGLSQEQLASLAGVTRQTISSIETGQYVPSALLAFVLAERLGKGIDELFTLVTGGNS